MPLNPYPQNDEGPGAATPDPESMLTPFQESQHDEDIDKAQIAQPEPIAESVRLGGPANPAPNAGSGDTSTKDGDNRAPPSPARRHRRRFRGCHGSAAMIVIAEVLSDGRRFEVRGQTAKALAALTDAGDRGVTAREAAGWAFRLAAYTHDLRTKKGLQIETLREGHPGGWHGRHVLRTAVRIVSVEAGEDA